MASPILCGQENGTPAEIDIVLADKVGFIDIMLGLGYLKQFAEAPLSRFFFGSPHAVLYLRYR